MHKQREQNRLLGNVTSLRAVKKGKAPVNNIPVPIRPGLTIYTNDKKNIPMLLEKYKDK